MFIVSCTAKRCKKLVDKIECSVDDLFALALLQSLVKNLDGLPIVSKERLNTSVDTMSLWPRQA